MNPAYLSLIGVICAVPTILLIDGLIVRGLVAAVLSGGLAVVAQTIRQGEGAFLLAVIRPIAAFAMIPILWMLIQVFPLKATGLAHPIWASAEQALGNPITGSISIDPNATTLALFQYLSALALTFLAAAASIDRERAEWVLFSLVVATALVAIVILGHDIVGFTFLTKNASLTDRAQAQVCVGLGTIFSIAAAIRTYERLESGRPRRPHRSLSTLMGTLVGCASAFTLCMVALISDLTGNILFALAYGIGVLLAVVAIRRIGLGFWGALAIVAAAGAGAIIVIATSSKPGVTDLTLAFASTKSNSLIVMTERMSADLFWTGSGAGTFASLVPVYQDGTDIIRRPTCPTAASKIAIELGHPMLWGIAVAVIIAIAALLRGALHRGRDSVYPAAGASSLLLLLLLSFGDNGVLGMPVSICAAAITGLAFAQRKSRIFA